ncbi:MAG: hypothetical protein ACI83P_001994, partial [Janthinobacterium sp.]
LETAFSGLTRVSGKVPDGCRYVVGDPMVCSVLIVAEGVPRLDNGAHHATARMD